MQCSAPLLAIAQTLHCVSDDDINSALSPMRDIFLEYLLSKSMLPSPHEKDNDTTLRNHLFFGFVVLGLVSFSFSLSSDGNI